jgi:hypothetical protein
MSTPAPQILTELKLSAAMKETVNTALDHGHMLSVAYVAPDGSPQLSFRGSVQAYSDNQLAIWVRNPSGGMLDAVRAGKSELVLLYGQLTPQKAFMTFRGRGRIDDTPAGRRAVYGNSPPLERDLDKEQKGVALVIDLISVDGFFGGNVLKMRR